MNVNSYRLRPSRTVIGGKLAFDALQLALPPVVGALGLLEDFDAVALFEDQVAIALAREVVERRDKDKGRAGQARWRGRRFLFLCDRGGQGGEGGR